MPIKMTYKRILSAVAMAMAVTLSTGIPAAAAAPTPRAAQLSMHPASVDTGTVLPASWPWDFPLELLRHLRIDCWTCFD